MATITNFSILASKVALTKTTFFRTSRKHRVTARPHLPELRHLCTQLSINYYVINNLLLETLDVDVRVGGFKFGGVLLDVGMEYSVPVVLVTVEGYTVAVLFCETDLYEWSRH